MFPLKDENPMRTKPILTLILITLNASIFIYSYFSGSFDQIVDSYGMKPAEVLSGRQLHTLFTSMFLHGGFLHLIGNMWYFWIFGDNIEDICGWRRFLLFYLASGLVASLVYAFSAPSSMVPTIGASGAISGVLGAYVVLYPRARVYTLVGYFLVMVPAIFILGFWFVLQLLYLYIGEMAGVAYWAHIGGFIAGALLIWPSRVSQAMTSA